MAPTAEMMPDPSVATPRKNPLRMLTVASRTIETTNASAIPIAPWRYALNVAGAAASSEESSHARPLARSSNATAPTSSTPTATTNGTPMRLPHANVITLFTSMPSARMPAIRAGV